MAFSMAENITQSTQLLAGADDMEVSSNNGRAIDSDIELDDNYNDELDDIMGDDATVFQASAFDDAVMEDESDGDHEDSDMADQPEPRPTDDTGNPEDSNAFERLSKSLQERDEQDTNESAFVEDDGHVLGQDTQHAIRDPVEGDHTFSDEQSQIKDTSSTDKTENREPETAHASEEIQQVLQQEDIGTEAPAPLVTTGPAVSDAARAQGKSAAETETPNSKQADRQNTSARNESDVKDTSNDTSSQHTNENNEDTNGVDEEIVSNAIDNTDAVEISQASNDSENVGDNLQLLHDVSDEIVVPVDKAEETHAQEEVEPPHHVIVSYENDEYALFCPRDLDETSSYLFDDEALVFESFSEVFHASRETLGISRSDCYLAFDIPEMGTTIHENSPHASVQTLWSLLDLYVQLCHIDGHDAAPPLYMHLILRQDLDQRLQALHRGLGSGLGLSSMHLLNPSHMTVASEDSHTDFEGEGDGDDASRQDKNSDGNTNVSNDTGYAHDAADEFHVLQDEGAGEVGNDFRTAKHDLETAAGVSTNEEKSSEPANQTQAVVENPEELPENLEETGDDHGPHQHRQSLAEEWLDGEVDAEDNGEEGTYIETFDVDGGDADDEHLYAGINEDTRDQQAIEDETQKPLEADANTVVLKPQEVSTDETTPLVKNNPGQTLQEVEEDDLISLPSLDGDGADGNGSSTATPAGSTPATLTQGHKRSWSEEGNNGQDENTLTSTALASDHDAKRSRAA